MGFTSLPARGAWIEIIALAAENTETLSLPARGAWIEMKSERDSQKGEAVAPRTGSVD